MQGQQHFDVRREVTTISFAIAFGSLGALTLGAKPTPPPFPGYVKRALAVVAWKTRVPVMGPLRLPISSSVYPNNGTFLPTRMRHGRSMRSRGGGNIT